MMQTDDGDPQPTELTATAEMGFGTRYGKPRKTRKLPRKEKKRRHGWISYTMEWAMWTEDEGK